MPALREARFSTAIATLNRRVQGQAYYGTLGGFLMTDPANIRQHMLRVRRSIPPSFHHVASAQITHQLVSSRRFRNAKIVGAYLPLGNEADLSSLLYCTNQHGALTPDTNDKTFVFPRVDGERIIFHHVGDRTHLTKSKWGILEPKHDRPIIDAEDIDLLCMPLTAYSLAGNRIGMGGGFYDRLLANLTDKPIRVGIAFNWQQGYWQAETWDQGLDAILTERGWHNCVRS